jgi:hypothetical protein
VSLGYIPSSPVGRETQDFPAHIYGTYQTGVVTDCGVFFGGYQGPA